MLLTVDRLGVLLIGKSGSGKSELALELVARGHRLVADDAVEWRRAGAAVIGRAPPSLAGFIEVRGLGVLDLRALYGRRALAPAARLRLVIELGARASSRPEARLVGDRGVYQVLGVRVPKISLPRRLGHNSAVLVEAACRDQRLREAGRIAPQRFAARLRRRLQTSSP